MRGIDLSHWNNVIDWDKVKASGKEFCIIKATEGTTYLDPTYKERKDKVRNAGMLLGVYHFANSTNAVKEAEWFLSQVGELKEGELVVLDYENYKLSNPASWCLAWLNHVEKALGFKPILYTYHGILKSYNWKKVSDNNNGLWSSRYGLQEQTPNLKYQPSNGSWSFRMMWQYCSKGIVPGIIGNVGLNTTDMSLNTLKKYGQPVCLHCPTHCPK